MISLSLIFGYFCTCMAKNMLLLLANFVTCKFDLTGMDMELVLIITFIIVAVVMLSKEKKQDR
ncbi:hypothetical protein DI392_16215 [Vibrio albus]|uniref:Uncharacterized protein n=1 Tax=Vibrio albus TaxID=2200953 RepID=A0A2U3B604_9VIBR|nr:hypothetical protein DI392_16215 [Vibrio albus]